MMEHLFSRLFEVILAAINQVWVAFTESPLLALPVLLLLSLLVLRDWKILFDVLLLILVSAVVFSVSQQGMDLVETLKVSLSSSAALK